MLLDVVICAYFVDRDPTSAAISFASDLRSDCNASTQSYYDNLRTECNGDHYAVSVSYCYVYSNQRFVYAQTKAAHLGIKLSSCVSPISYKKREKISRTRSNRARLKILQKAAITQSKADKVYVSKMLSYCNVFYALLTYHVSSSIKTFTWVPFVGIVLVFAPQVSAQMFRQHDGLQPEYFPDGHIDAPNGILVPPSFMSTFAFEVAAPVAIGSSVGGAAAAFGSIFGKI